MIDGFQDNVNQSFGHGGHLGFFGKSQNGESGILAITYCHLGLKSSSVSLYSRRFPRYRQLKFWASDNMGFSGRTSQDSQNDIWPIAYYPLVCKTINPGVKQSSISKWMELVLLHRCHLECSPWIYPLSLSSNVDLGIIAGNLQGPWSFISLVLTCSQFCHSLKEEITTRQKGDIALWP